MGKEIVGLKLSQAMNSDFITKKYKILTEGESEESKEKYMAKLFNLSLIFFQLSKDEDLYKNFIDKYFRLDGSNDEYPNIDSIELLGNALMDLSVPEMAHALRHGVLVHFTTPGIAEKIKSDGKMSNLFSDDDKRAFYNAMAQADPNSEYFFTTGFNFKNGICAGSITTAFYMFHTPETLSFLYGGNFVSGNYEKAMEHVRKSTENMSPDVREDVRNRLEKIWKIAASKNSRTAILIDRDKLEYKKDNYYRDGKLAYQVERRPFKKDNLYDIHQIETNLIEQELPTDALFFVNVPTIAEIDRRCMEEKEKYK